MIKCQLTSDWQILFLFVAHLTLSNKVFRLPINKIVLYFKDTRPRRAGRAEKELLINNRDIYPAVKEEDGVLWREQHVKKARGGPPPHKAGVTNFGNYVKRHFWDHGGALKSC